ncbi:MAG: hypothetical protein VB858_11370 [Planctomycetaceae bacterium]
MIENLASSGQLDRYISYAHRHVRLAKARGVGRSQPSTPFGESKAGMGSPSRDDLWEE